MNSSIIGSKIETIIGNKFHFENGNILTEEEYVDYLKTYNKDEDIVRVGGVHLIYYKHYNNRSIQTKIFIEDVYLVDAEPSPKGLRQIFKVVNGNHFKVLSADIIDLYYEFDEEP